MLRSQQAAIEPCKENFMKAEGAMNPTCRVLTDCAELCDAASCIFSGLLVLLC